MLNHESPYRYLCWILLLGCSLLSTPAQALENRQDIEKELRKLQASPEAELVPKAVERVRAYLGAAMLAADQGDTDGEQIALSRAREAVEEGWGNARFIKNKFTDLMQLKAAAKEAAANVNARDDRAAEEIPVWISKGDAALREVFRAAGEGKLNVSQQKAGSVRAAYTNAINTAVPILLNKAEQALRSAANKNAKSYTPVVYGDAKNAYAALKRYNDGIAKQPPQHPALALKLAERAIEIALQVKEWRKQSGSHEELLLEARRQRLELGSALGMELASPVDDFNMTTLLDAVRQLKSQLDDQEKRYEARISKLKADSERHETKALTDLRNRLQGECAEQLAAMKDAYRAKIERVTFDDKRRKSVQQLFDKDEVEIQSGIDGSMLLRLTKLKFAPGKTTVDPQYFEFLGRVKEALSLYDDRQISINGHTDNQGDLKENQKLSLARAEAVMDFFVAAGISQERMKAYGYGEVRPIASNEFARGRDMNRRIDVVIEAPAREEPAAETSNAAQDANDPA